MLLNVVSWCHTKICKRAKTKKIKPKSHKKCFICSQQTGKSEIQHHKNVAGLFKYSLLRGDAKGFLQFKAIPASPVLGISRGLCGVRNWDFIWNAMLWSLQGLVYDLDGHWHLAGVADIMSGQVKIWILCCHTKICKIGKYKKTKNQKTTKNCSFVHNRLESLKFNITRMLLVFLRIVC